MRGFRRFLSVFPGPILIIVLLVLAARLPVPGVHGDDSGEGAPMPLSRLQKMVLPGSQDLQLIVQLAEPSVTEWMRAGESLSGTSRLEFSGGSAGMGLQSSQALSYRGQIEAAQQILAEKVAVLPGARMEGSLTTVMNALMVRIPPEQYNSLRSLPGIKKVYFSRLHKRLLDTSAELVNAQGLWSKAGGSSVAGRGVKIGIIDTGIDITNPMFIDNSLTVPSGYPKGESAYTNRKVIVARNYMHLLSRSQAIRTAVDEDGHGTFVAGVAAGRQVAAPMATISGMAPGAFLGSYKVFGTPGINDYTTTNAVLAAIEAAVADGMDIVNMSLGSLDYLLPSEDPEIAAVDNAVQAGVLFVLAAGNEGSATQTIGSPATAANAIAVGSVSNSRIFASQIHVTAPLPVPAALADMAYAVGSGPQFTQNQSAAAVIDVQALDGNGYGCEALPSGSLTGKIAFLQRGGVGTACTFAVKVNNADAAGAISVIVFNNLAADGIIQMGGLSGTRIPALMISNRDGLALKSYIALYPGTTLVAIDSSSVLKSTLATGRMISSFSSVGPTADFRLKPDLVAVGENVYSATQSVSPSGYMYDSSKFLLNQGTSFSSPMVAGAAAGLKQLYPSLNAFGIKSMLVQTASRNLTGDGVNPASVLQGGSGLLDMGSASAAGIVCDPVSLNFGVQSYSGHLTLSRTFTIKNISSTADRYSLSFELLNPGPRIAADQDSIGPVSPSASADIRITLDADAPLSGGFQGFVVLRAASGPPVYRIPFWAGLYAANPDRILTVSQTASGADSYKSLASAVLAAQPGNIIEIADSATYPGGLTIATNREGLPLHGLTIRAAAGQTPTIDGTGLTSQPGILIMGLRNVLLQGLKISGGWIGVYLEHTSSVSPLSATIDHCTITGTTEGTGPVGVEIDGGGTLEITQSVISGSRGSGIVIGAGTYFTLSDSTVDANGNVGIDADSSNLRILNSTVRGSAGPGIYATYCVGTVSESLFSGNRGAYGDGVEIIDGNFRILSSRFESNERYGLLLSRSSSVGSEPIAHVSQTTFKGNKSYALYGNPVSSLTMEGSTLKDNVKGMRLAGASAALLRNNVIVRSTDTLAGNGLEVAGTSKVQLINNTIYRNAGLGIVLLTGPTLSVRNCILSGNRLGDIQGLTVSHIEYSLVGDRLLGGSNITGDPLLLNPDADVFDPASGSPAINAGSNEAANLPFLDFYQKLRIAGPPEGSDGRVDMGAVESNSSYSLVFPMMANGTQAALGGDYATGFALLNAGTSSTEASLAAFSSAGSVLASRSNPARQSLAAGAQLPTLAPQVFGFDDTQPNLGGVLVSSAQRLAGFFLLFDSQFRRFAEGVNVSSDTATDLIFMRHEKDASGRAIYCLFNPGPNAANIQAGLLGPAGTLMETARTVVIAPKGQLLLEFDTVGSSGYVRVLSDRPIAGLELIGNSSELSLLPGVTPGPEALLLIPHIAFHQGFETTIGLVNSKSSITTVLLTAFTDSGRILGTPATVTVAANGQVLKSAADLFGLGTETGLTTGYVVAECGQEGILGFTQFRYNDGTRQSSAAVSTETVPKKHLVFSHVAHQVPSGSGVHYQTGIALVNPFGAPVAYTLKAYDAAGVLLAEKTEKLNPRQKVARILSHPTPGVGFFTRSLTMAGGHVEVWTDYGLLGFELFFTEDFSQLASVPAQ